MEGTWWNSTLQHGGETPADNSGWQSDRAIHRLSGPQELAFAAKFTGRYDDLQDYLDRNEGRGGAAKKKGGAAKKKRR